MSSRTIIIGISLFSLVFIFGSYFLLTSGSKPEVKILSYTLQDKERPRAEVKKTLTDFGVIKVSDPKEAIFTIKNTGVKPLQVYSMSSSCHCTFGQLSYQGKTSDEFGMSKISDTLAEISPNTQAKVKVIYRPYLMPVYGKVEREVYLLTNDPQNSRLVFQVTAIVQ